MRFGRTNVNKYLVGEQRRNPAIAGEFSMLISDVVRSCKAISQSVSLGKLILRERYGTTDLKKMANELFLHHCDWGGHLAAISSATASFSSCALISRPKRLSLSLARMRAAAGAWSV